MSIPTKLEVILDDLANDDGEVRATNRELADALGLTGTSWRTEVSRSLRRLEKENQLERTSDRQGNRVIVLT